MNSKFSLKQAIIFSFAITFFALLPRQAAPALADASAVSSADSMAVCNVAEPSSPYWQQYCQTSSSALTNSSTANYYSNNPYTTMNYPTTQVTQTNSSGINHSGLCNVAEPGSPYWQQYCQNNNSGSVAQYPTQTQYTYNNNTNYQYQNNPYQYQNSGNSGAQINHTQLSQIGNCTYTSTIQWSASTQNAQVTVNSGEGDKLFAAGQSGNQAASWLVGGSNYHFILWDASTAPRKFLKDMWISVPMTQCYNQPTYYPTPTPTPVYFPNPNTNGQYQTSPSSPFYINPNNLYIHSRNDTVCDVAEPGSVYWQQYCR